MLVPVTFDGHHESKHLMQRCDHGARHNCRWTAVSAPHRPGYSKMLVSGDLHSVTGVSGAFEGVVISFNPETVYETAAYDTFHDTIGNTLGVPDPTGNIARKTTHVGSDRATNMNAETSAGGTTYFRPHQNNFNIKGAGRMWL